MPKIPTIRQQCALPFILHSPHTRRCQGCELWGKKFPICTQKDGSPPFPPSCPKFHRSPWSNACTKLLTAGPLVPQAAGDGTRDVHSVCPSNIPVPQGKLGGYGGDRWLGALPRSLPTLLVSPVQAGVSKGKNLPWPYEQGSQGAGPWQSPACPRSQPGAACSKIQPPLGWGDIRTGRMQGMAPQVAPAQPVPNQCRGALTLILLLLTSHPSPSTLLAGPPAPRGQGVHWAGGGEWCAVPAW